MNDLSGEVRRLCIALEVEENGRRTDPERRKIRRRLAEVIADVGKEAGLDRLYVAERGTPVESGTTTVMYREEQGDGLLLLLPSGVSEARVIAGFIGEMRLALRRHNRQLRRDDPERLRLRVAFHQGPTQVGDSGFAGRAVAMVCHLRDGEEPRRALERNPDADLAVIVSAQLFEDVIEHEHRDLRKHMFRPVTVNAGEVVAEAWIGLPDTVGGRLPFSRQARANRSPARERSTLYGPIVNIDEY
ncbi:hypothetical protein GCM10022226_17100 [Sphaerisporangium flaviroseum]|uniref:Guanylate cyclase domain-containing protein n=1 Tax=Sphaerisporangium flaviroseum TaxID=509199 RepID=A0ABP7HP12_9ACTN